jgi:hypothetical protein
MRMEVVMKGRKRGGDENKDYDGREENDGKDEGFVSREGVGTA